jgi:hypothetical protein
MLSEDTLLDVFDFYRLDAIKQSLGHPWKWHRLAHVCKRWRCVMIVSPRRLGLQILCKSGAPIESILDSWPTLPLVIRHKGLESRSLPDNIIVALRRTDRVCAIDLVLTSSITGSIVEAIQEPFQALERIRITVEDAAGSPLVVRNAFLGGSAPHLREIKLDGIDFPFPEIRQVLLSTNNLVELHLANLPNDLYVSPDDLVTGLTTLVQLKRLTIGFHSPALRPPSRMTRLPKRTSLPSLTFLGFHGASNYLEEFVARIDLPALCKITIRLFNDLFFEIPQFSQFIPRLNMLGPPTRVLVTHSVDCVGIFFSQEGKSSNENFLFETSCRRLDWQLSFVTQISSQLSPFLSSVRLLGIQGVHKLPTGEEDVDSTQWLEFFRPFTYVTRFNVFDKDLVPGIVQALVVEDTATEVFPELSTLHLSESRSSPSVEKAAEQFVATRRLSGRTVHLTS